jgi:hypothetical protein
LKRLENSAFAEERQHFTATLKEFIKALKKVLPELTYTNNASKFLTHATIFLDNATRSERSDFLEDLLRSPAALIRPLDNVDRRVEGE